MGCALTPTPVPLAANSDAPRATLRGVRAVAFDLDGTLVDVLRAKAGAAEAAAWALADAGMDDDPAEAAAAIARLALEWGLDRADVVDEHLRRRFGRADPALAALARRAYARGELASAVAYPRARRTLRELARRGFALVLVTDAPRANALARLRAAGLHRFFRHVVAFEDTGRGKVDAAPFAIAARLVGAAPHEVAMVGDNPERDVGAARAFGCRTVLAEYGLQPQFAHALAAHRPDRAIRWLDDLLALLPEPAPVRGAVERSAAAQKPAPPHSLLPGGRAPGGPAASPPASTKGA